MRSYVPLAGEHIKQACTRAIFIARSNEEDCGFKFNDIALIATPDSTVEQLEKLFFDEMDRAHQEYEASPKGIAAMAQRQEEVKQRQEAVSRLACADIEEMSMDEVIAWLKEFTHAADDIEVRKPLKTITQLLEAAGFEANAHVGKEPGWFNTRQRMGEYVVGQAMECMKRGMPPHPICLTFCKKYEAL